MTTSNDGAFALSFYCHKCNHTASSLAAVVGHCVESGCGGVLDSLSFEKLQDLFERKIGRSTYPKLPGEFPDVAV